MASGKQTSGSFGTFQGLRVPSFTGLSKRSEEEEDGVFAHIPNFRTQEVLNFKEVLHYSQPLTRII